MRTKVSTVFLVEIAILLLVPVQVSFAIIIRGFPNLNLSQIELI